MLLGLEPLASAGSALTYVTPQAMAAHVRGTIPQIDTGNAAVPSLITASVCTGLGASHQGKFNTFRCRANWQRGVANVWARARPGGQFCASSTGLDACPAAAPTVGDPRVCSNAPAPPTADPNHCALGSAILALQRAMSVKFAAPNIQLLNLTCTGKNLKWTCVFATSASSTVYHGAIVFAQSTAGKWTASVNGCTVSPGAPSGGYRWRTGPTPVCT